MGLAIGDCSVFSVLAEGATTRTVKVQMSADSVTSDGARVAVGKRLQARMVRDETARRQLETEASILRALDGRGAPRLFDEGSDRAGPWILMEHLPLETLASYGVTLGDLPERAAFVDRVSLALFRGLDTVHSATDARGPLGVVHADVSPTNVLMAIDPADGTVNAALVDFGLAHYRDAPPTRGDSLRGTPRYLAPEVARGETATSRSDRFALALALLELASGKACRTATHLPSLILQAAEEPVTAYAEAASAALSPDVRAALLDVLRFEPAERPASAREAWRRGSW